MQISIETIIDICNIIVSNLRLSIPSDEEETFKKLKDKNIISQKTSHILTNMKGFRNILVHKYAIVKDELVYELLTKKLGDFEKFKEEILKFIS